VTLGCTCTPAADEDEEAAAAAAALPPTLVAAEAAPLQVAPPPGGEGARGKPPPLPKLLRNAAWRALYRDFVVQSYDDSSLAFYTAVRDYEACCDQCLASPAPSASALLPVTWSKAAMICDAFLEVDAYDTIELDDQSRSAIIERVREGRARSQQAERHVLPDRDAFSGAVATVVRALARETYPSFCRSEQCNELLLLIAAEAEAE